MSNRSTSTDSAESEAIYLESETVSAANDLYERAESEFPNYSELFLLGIIRCLNEKLRSMNNAKIHSAHNNDR